MQIASCIFKVVLGAFNHVVYSVITFPALIAAAASSVVVKWKVTKKVCQVMSTVPAQHLINHMGTCFLFSLLRNNKKNPSTDKGKKKSLEYAINTIYSENCMCKLANNKITLFSILT